MDRSNPLRSYRTANALTLEQLGAQFGVHKTTVMRWEDDRVPAERVIEIERVTGVPRQRLRPDLYPQTRRVA